MLPTNPVSMRKLFLHNLIKQTAHRSRLLTKSQRMALKSKEVSYRYKLEILGLHFLAPKLLESVESMPSQQYTTTGLPKGLLMDPYTGNIVGIPESTTSSPIILR